MNADIRTAEREGRETSAKSAKERHLNFSRLSCGFAAFAFGSRSRFRSQESV